MSLADDLAVKGLEGASFQDSTLVVGVRLGNRPVVGLVAEGRESHRGEMGAGGGLEKGASAATGKDGPVWRVTEASEKGCDRSAGRIATWPRG